MSLQLTFQVESFATLFTLSFSDFLMHFVDMLTKVSVFFPTLRTLVLK